MVLVHYTLSESALQMFEVSLKYLLGFSSYNVDAILFWSDGQTDAKTKGKKTICLSTHPRGIHT